MIYVIYIIIIFIDILTGAASKWTEKDANGIFLTAAICAGAIPIWWQMYSTHKELTKMREKLEKEANK